MDAPPVQYVRTRDGFSIAYTVSGEGVPLVLTSQTLSDVGANWTSPLMRQTFQNLASVFRLVRYDARGQGMSTRGLPESLTLNDFVCDVEAVVDGLQLGNFVLFGQLQHGKVAFEYAVQHPERVIALVLWNSHPSRPRTGAYGAGRTLALSNWDYLVESSIKTAYPQEDPVVHIEVARQAVTPDDFVKMVGTLADYDLRPELSACQVPTLVLATRAATWAFASEEGGREFAAGVPNSRLLVFDDVGGGLYTLSPELPPAVTAIRDFVASLPARDVSSGTAPGPLSTREVEVLRLVAAGHSNQQVADELVISLNTVRRHVSNIFAKVGAANRADAVSYAHRNRLV